jgi:polar amino acid transport system substrate-binding protein
LTEEEYAFGVDKSQPELLQSANAFIAQIMQDGTFDEITNKYFGDGTPSAVISAKEDASKNQLVVATNAAFEPFEYKEGENYYGIDMEIAAAFAAYLGCELVIKNMDFDAVCLSVGEHKADIAMAGLTVKEDRKEYVNFTDSYYKASQVVIAKSSDTTFDKCTDLASAEAILNGFDDTVKIGVQMGTTGEFYVKGDESWGFAGLKTQCVSYKSGALAVQDLLNGKVDYVIIDVAPANCITEAINEMQ